MEHWSQVRLGEERLGGRELAQVSLSCQDLAPRMVIVARIVSGGFWGLGCTGEEKADMGWGMGLLWKQPQTLLSSLP